MIPGESYASHYIPAISNHIWEKNQEEDDDFKIPLKGLAIGNGLTNGEIQYTAYPDMALDGGKCLSHSTSLSTTLSREE